MIRTVLAMVVLALAPVAWSQDARPYYSVEWLVEEADVIVRASIIDVMNDGPTVVLLDVKETLKGGPPSIVRLTYDRNPAPYVEFEKMRPHGERLWFLKKKSRDYGELDNVYHGSNQIGLSAKEPKTWQGLPVFRMTLETIDTPAALLEAVRELVRTGPHPRKVKTRNVSLPYEWMKRLGKDSWGVDYLQVPEDARLEAVALEMIRNPEKILRPSGADTDAKAILMLRREGASALRHFRSKENIALLRTLLEDPSYFVSNDTRHYSVRLGAFETLEAWEVKVERPVTEEKVATEKQTGEKQ